jgi:P2 family phage contractile tail tube protein
MIRSTIIEDAIIRLNGTDELVGIAAITLPDIEHKTETINGLGVIEHDEPIPTAFNAMKLQLKFMNRCKDIVFEYGSNVNLTAKAAILVEDSETHNNDEVEAIYSFKGKRIKTSGGDIGKAVKNETELEFSLTYYKEEIQGKVIHEIDVYNKKAIVNGKDLYEKVRSILS